MTIIILHSENFLFWFYPFFSDHNPQIILGVDLVLSDKDPRTKTSSLVTPSLVSDLQRVFSSHRSRPSEMDGTPV